MKPSWLAEENFLSSSKDNLEYKLLSVVTHLGHHSSSGHYMTHALQRRGKWLCFDDQVKLLMLKVL